MRLRKKQKNKENKNTIQKLLFNGGVVGECRGQIGSVVDDRGSCTLFGGIGPYDSRGGCKDHPGHQNERHRSCSCDHNRYYRDGRMTRYTFAIEAERADSHPEAAIAWRSMTGSQRADLLAATVAVATSSTVQRSRADAAG
uniref:Uncharacterized protein n=1 Tax=Romanomermis culicivorax TaxID=13658 RepID=A0A915K6D8_ROMCU